MPENKLQRFISEPLTAFLGVVLALSPVFRFSWDPATQTVLHAAFLSALVLLGNRRRLPFSAAPAGLFLALLLVPLLSLPGAEEKAVVRNETLVLFDALCAAYLVSLVPAERRRGLLLIPVLAGLWLSVILLAYFAADPVRYVRLYTVDLGFLVNFNIAAGYLVLCFPVSFLFWKDRGKAYRLLTLFLFLGIILTKSRAAILVASAAGGLLLVREHRKHLRSALLLAAAAAALAAAFTFVKYRDPQRFAPDRVEWVQAAWQMFRDNPFNGVGWGNFGNLYPRYRTTPAQGTAYAHNLPVHLLAETGLPGTVFLCALGCLLALGYRAGRRGPLPHDAAPLAIAAGGFLVLNLFDYSFFIPAPMILFFSLAGAQFFREAPYRERPLTAPPIAWFACAALAAVVALPLIGGIQYSRGLAQLKKEGRLDLARKTLERSIRADALPSLAYNALAELHFIRFTETRDPGELREALAMERAAIDRFPSNAAYWSDLSWLSLVAADRPAAREAAEQAVRLDPRNPRYPRVLEAVLQQEPPGNAR